MDNKSRCAWCLKDEMYMDYHDNVWGVPVHDDRQLFEFLTLEGAQAGLSWYTVLVKAENYKKAFANWDVRTIAQFTEDDVQHLLVNKGIIRNKLKIRSTIQNANCFLQVQKEFGSFDQYIWQFTGHKTIINQWKSLNEVPAKTKESDAMSKALKKRGFKFVGSTICYAFMQAVGIVDDHILSCWKRQK